MLQLSHFPKIEPDSIEAFLRENGFPGDDSGAAAAGRTKRVRKTRSSFKKVIENIAVDGLKIEKLTESRTFRIEGYVKEAHQSTAAAIKAPTKGRKSKGSAAAAEKKKAVVESHFVRAEFCEVTSQVKVARCTDCDQTKVKCTKLHAYLVWIQQKQQETIQQATEEENASKKIKRERNGNGGILKPINVSVAAVESTTEVVKKLASLPKLKKEAKAVCPIEMETAMKLSLFNLIREYPGNDSNEFLEFCAKRMQEENCGNAQILTVEQADTDLWHELRKGRITASRIHEASRCTMLNGSLTSKIMGLSSGFSFAMKRGTDLEGHVFAVLKKEYPSLRNTGLVLDPQFPWMGASPDGLADDFVLEIKCPYTPNTYECYVDVNKLSKKYFAQIQLQMHMTHQTKALLGVAALDFERTRNVTKVWIDYDKEYVDGIMAEAFEFWQKGVFPALMRKRKSKK